MHILKISTMIFFCFTMHFLGYSAEVSQLQDNQASGKKNGHPMAYAISSSFITSFATLLLLHAMSERLPEIPDMHLFFTIPLLASLITTSLISYYKNSSSEKLKSSFGFCVGSTAGLLCGFITGLVIEIKENGLSIRVID